MRNKYFILLLFAVLFYNPLSLFAEGKSSIKYFGPYSVQLTQDFETGKGRLKIQKNKTTIFEESGFDHHYTFGNNFDPNVEGKDPYSGKDLLHTGSAFLVISNWTGGAHCCHFLHLFEIGKEFKKLVTVEANSSNVYLKDLDHDKIPEIEFWEGSIDYLFSSFANSPGGKVVLKFNKDHYEVYPALMKTPIPSPKKITKIKTKIKFSFNETTPELPYEFLKMMMELSYSGHFDLAVKLDSDVWPKDKPELSKFLNEYKDALKDSKYWREFQTASGKF